jgi:AcrR family transcriptional regulator
MLGAPAPLAGTSCQDRPVAAPQVARSAAEEALLDAAERLLVEVGHAGITTRRVAEEAGVNHGLVHYYFGSIENLFVRVLERFTAELTARQRAMYASDVPFIEKWRLAMRYLVAEDVAYEKIWFELQALAWNRPELRERVANVNDEWRAVLTEAFAGPRERYRIEMPLDALVSLVMTFNEGVIVERLSGITTGHEELLAWIEGWVEEKERHWQPRKR